MELFYLIQLDNGSRYLTTGSNELALKCNDWCVVRKDFYQDYGQVIRIKNSSKEDPKSLPSIMRKATVHDKGVANENLMRGKSALRTTEKSVERLNLPMNLLNAHYSFDGKLILIQFTAEERVDFRELVKELMQIFNTRIELRQIGVRDETALCGGIGICGQELCCRRFLTEFASINVRMAKEQDLSLTPATISGSCGRLKCCLKYEHDGYLELEKGMPRRGELCECSEGRGRVIDRNLLTQKLTLQLESGKNMIFCRDEVTSKTASKRSRGEDANTNS
ncbi:MAG: regulatory iron-sulfur-containing complex subunit RicT [Victivallaceae bacterium]|nr:regulatory iron-sulfur-containing complex subunit RicT [Victivallaceae bacterium]MDD4181391.1 regulatory iron-sulfur-containing complex subunit RicT [Victivallaceae bacterium]